jgi:hypothetical protein
VIVDDENGARHTSIVSESEERGHTANRT